MAVTLTSADNALKSFYLDAIAQQIKYKVNPFFAKIKETTDDVYGKDVKKLAVYGVNGGIGAGTEDGSLPQSSGNNYKVMTSTLKNLYGTIEISDKAIRASADGSGAFVSLLNAETEGLVLASAKNFDRMLFGSSSGVIASLSQQVDGGIIVDSIDNLAVGMIIDVYDAISYTKNTTLSGRKILSIAESTKKLTLSGATITEDLTLSPSYITNQGSLNNELTGLTDIFNSNLTSIYGLTKADNPWLIPSVTSSVGALTELKIQAMLDTIEKKCGDQPDFILCSYGVRRAIQDVLSKVRSFEGSMQLEGGYKTIAYNGIPVIADSNCPNGTMYFLNSNDFAIHQLCDWQWLEGDDGKILHQVTGKPVYTATLVKYAELMCSRPCAQGKMVGITEK